MLSTIAKILISILIFLSSLIFLILLFLKLIVLNEAFYAYSLHRGDTYTNLAKALKGAARQSVINQVNQTQNYEALTVGQRQTIDAQIETYTTFINEQNLQNFLEPNLKNILNYLGNKSPYLMFYFPINDWNLPQKTISQIPDYFKSGEINASQLIENNPKFSAQDLVILHNIKNTQSYITMALFASIVLNLILIFIYSLFYKKSKKQGLGKMLSFIGIAVLVLGWIIFTANNIFAQGLAFKTGWGEILAGTLVTLYATPLVYIFTIYGLTLLIYGVILFNKKDKSKLVSKAKLG